MPLRLILGVFLQVWNALELQLPATSPRRSYSWNASCVIVRSTENLWRQMRCGLMHWMLHSKCLFAQNLFCKIWLLISYALYTSVLIDTYPMDFLELRSLCVWSQQRQDHQYLIVPWSVIMARFINSFLVSGGFRGRLMWPSVSLQWYCLGLSQMATWSWFLRTLWELHLRI